MKRTAQLIIAALLLGFIVALGGMVSQSASACRPSTPEGVEFCKELNNSFGKTFVVTNVTGTPRRGFTVTYDNGWIVEYVPRAKAICKCKELDRRVDRVKCKATVRTEYRYLKILKQSLRAA